MLFVSDCEGRQHGHHRHHPPRNRRHHHDSDFFETGASHTSESQQMDTSRSAHHSPHNHHHRAKGHHSMAAANTEQHFASQAKTYESKYETSYSYGDDYKDDSPPRLGKGGFFSPESDDYDDSSYPIQLDQDSMHNSQVATKITGPQETQPVSVVASSKSEAKVMAPPKKLPAKPIKADPQSSGKKSGATENNPEMNGKLIREEALDRSSEHPPGLSSVDALHETAENQPTEIPESLPQETAMDEPDRKTKKSKSSTRKGLPALRAKQVNSHDNKESRGEPQFADYGPGEKMMNDAPVVRTHNLIR